MIIKAILLIIICSSLLACESPPESLLTNYLEQFKNQPQQLPEPLPRWESLAPIVYSNEDKLTDPFYKITNPEKKQRSNNKRYKKLALESFKFVGIMQSKSETLGLMARSDGKLFSIRVGENLDNKGEKIIEINENFIKIESRIKANASWKKEIRFLYLNSQKK
ncbi:MAG: pilus assembly protein PilP [Tatlockia sp.]|nr:pilus assembly protein PilP [Tatlockia sp.]